MSGKAHLRVYLRDRVDNDLGSCCPGAKALLQLGQQRTEVGVLLRKELSPCAVGCPMRQRNGLRGCQSNHRSTISPLTLNETEHDLADGAAFVDDAQCLAGSVKGQARPDNRLYKSVFDHLAHGLAGGAIALRIQ
jgi:hypothetical protein